MLAKKPAQISRRPPIKVDNQKAQERILARNQHIITADPALPDSLDPNNSTESQWYDWNKQVGVEGEFYLLYFGVHAPSLWKRLALPEDEQFQVDIIDTWEMTISPLEETYSGKCEIKLPSGKEFQALRIQKV